MIIQFELTYNNTSSLFIGISIRLPFFITFSIYFTIETFFFRWLILDTQTNPEPLLYNLII